MVQMEDVSQGGLFVSHLPSRRFWLVLTICRMPDRLDPLGSDPVAGLSWWQNFPGAKGH